MRIFTVVLAALFALSGCADKPGGRFTTTPGPVSDENTSSPTGFQLEDPGQTKSIVTIDANGNRAIMGSMHTQTSEATGTKLSEANTGGAPQQRAIMTIGDIKAMLSTAADFDWSDIDATFDNGKLQRLKVGKLSTSTSTVVKAVNEGIIAETQAWIAGTQADRDVQIKRLETQSQGVGAVADVAKGALKLIETLKTLSTGTP